LALNDAVIRYENADLIPGQNVTFTTVTAPKPYLALDVQDNFENDGWATIDAWFFQDPDLLDLTITTDPVNPSNHVADYNRSGSFEWTNAQFILDHRMNLTVRNEFEMNAYFPSSNNYTGALTPTAAIKLQNSLLGPNAWSTQTEILVTVTEFDQWVTLNFDFGAIVDSANYDQVVVQFGGEGHLVPAQFYFDDLALLDDPISIQETQGINIDIYPNPAVDVINIPQNTSLTQLEMFNMTGQRVIKLMEVPQQISVSRLPEGIYTIVAICIDGEQFTTKVLVQ
nr:T9SS type A sorting domain-containing protein [Bacteroidota bacterium]